MDNNTNLKNGDRIEDLQNGYAILQNDAYFSFGTDAVLLAHFADIKVAKLTRKPEVWEGSYRRLMRSSQPLP